MSLRIYDTARNKFARGELRWHTDLFSAALVRSSYVIDLVNHKLLGDIGGALAIVPVIGLGVDTRGWCKAEPIFFSTTPANREIGYVVIYRRTDGVLVIVADFETLSTGPTGKPFILLQGLSTPGLFRV